MRGKLRQPIERRSGPAGPGRHAVVQRPPCAGKVDERPGQHRGDHGHQHENREHLELGYVRPHELEVSRVDDGRGLSAVVNDVRVTGAVVKMELREEAGGLVQVELGRDRYEATSPAVGERVYVKPKNVRIFLQD